MKTDRVTNRLDILTSVSSPPGAGVPLRSLRHGSYVCCAQEVSLLIGFSNGQRIEAGLVLEHKRLVEFPPQRAGY